MKKNNEKGFSLVELLVVVIIIAIVAAIAIPNLLASRRAANDAQAVSNLRTIVSGNVTYQATLGGSNNYAATMAALSNADLIDDAWGATPPVTRGAFIYTYTYDTTANGYCITAQGSATGTNYSYAVSHQGVVYRNGGTTVPSCTASTGVITGGSVF